MSWSFTINNLNAGSSIPDAVIEEFGNMHASYPADMFAALNVAKETGLASVTCTGGRTINPYNRDEVVIITISGMRDSPDFNATMKSIIRQGPDESEKT